MIESQHKARMMTSFISQNCRFQQKTTSGVLHLFHLLPKILDCRGLLFLKNILYIDEIAPNSYRYGETALALACGYSRFTSGASGDSLFSNY